MGRPDTYDPIKAAAICDRLAMGESLRAICRTPGMPPEATVRSWCVYHDDFAAQYARARDRGLDVMADEIIAISDEQHEVVTEAGRVFDPEVNRDKLRVDARKWYLSKLAPKRYGDRLALEHSGSLTISERLVAARKRTNK